MKFSCEKETLLNLLNIASRAVTGKSSMPLLEGLLLAADADTLPSPATTCPWAFARPLRSMW